MKIGKEYKGERIWIYILTFLASRSEIAGIYPFAIAMFVGAYLAGCGSWGLFGAVLLGIATTFSFTNVISLLHHPVDGINDLINLAYPNNHLQ